MLSIIVCSVKPERLSLFERNVKETVGVPYEIILYDNRVHKKGICEVYNTSAHNAKYDYLCFVHEDVSFETKGWGQKLITFAGETEKCGVVGFAGATMKTSHCSGWMVKDTYNRCSLKQGCSHDLWKANMSVPYEKVVVLDGFFLFCSKQIWGKCPFDSTTFRKFHLYDLDFSLQAFIAGYQNYVCGEIDVIHKSSGTYNIEWIAETLKFHKKWEKHLPVSICRMSSKEIYKVENKASYKFIGRLIKVGIPHHFIINYFMERLKEYPLSFYNIRLLVKMFMRK